MAHTRTVHIFDTRLLAMVAGLFMAATLEAGAQDLTPRDRTGEKRNIMDGEIRTFRAASRLSLTEAERLAERMEYADALREQGQLDDAARVLRDVVRRQRDADFYARVALRRLAEVEYALDRPRDAANTLESLADMARDANDPAVEFDALVDASLLHQTVGDGVRHANLAPRIRKLMSSPAVPETAKSRLVKFGTPD